ncbi:hypothetical protein [Ruegeria arenilitoris]|uniref:hypothetical protein n=1 Tax=Ruegeria arenilitoris TaxID=1173585 RepID=UPI00147C62B7|nr:hypothetical protein [Ruegeria arenilitoris]
MGTVKAKKAFELENKGDHAIVHFEPSFRFQTVLTRFIWLITGIWVFGGWLPSLAFARIDKSYGGSYYSWPIFWAVWIIPVVALLFWGAKAWNKRTQKGSPASTIVLHGDRIDAPGWPKHTSYDHADLGTLYSQAPDTSFTYKSGKYTTDYKSKKQAAEEKGKIGFSVTADYGAERISIVHECLTEQQAVGIRDIIAEWRDDPSSVLENEHNASAA